MRRRLSAALAVIMVAGTVVAVAQLSAQASTATTPPFSQCPAIGASPSCQILIIVNSDRTVSVYGDPNVGPYDGLEDTLVGIQNDSSRPVEAITASGTPGLAGFDGDGLCTATGAPSECPFGPSGYEGPGTAFIPDATDTSRVEVDFSGGLAAGAHTYFSLEESLDAATLVVRLGTLEHDADGDGLPDAWESAQGRDLGGDLFDPTLYNAGARPDHKDIFLQIDHEVGAGFDEPTLKLIKDAFAKAPVTNPDQKPGINVHFVDGAVLSPAESDGLRKQNGDPDWGKISDRYKSDLEYHAYHYVLSTLWNSDVYAGQSDNTPGQFVVVDDCGSRTVSAWFGLKRVPRKSCEVSRASQAANLMHELGHNLGLSHGGAPAQTQADLENSEDPYKPNYLSVMNYSFSHSGMPGIGLDYSRWGADEVNKLDENSLAESDGVFATNPSNPFPSKAKTIYYCPANGTARAVALDRPVDWNCKYGVESGRISANIDWPDDDRKKGRRVWLKGQILMTSHDDWGNLVYNGGVIGQLARTYIVGPGVADVEKEPTPGLLRSIAAQVEPKSTVPTPMVVARSSESLTMQVPVSPAAVGSVSWAPVLNGGSEGESTSAATVSAGASTVVRFTVPRTSLVGAIGVSVTLETANWKVSNAVRTN